MLTIPKRPGKRMPDATILSASERILDYSVLGAAVIFLIATVIWLTKKLFQTQDNVLAVKDAHKEDAVKFAASSESLKSAMQTQAELMKMVLDELRHRGRE